MSLVRRLLSISVLAAWLPLFGQSPDAGTISGLVSDPSGARITYANVHVHGALLDRELSSDGVGSFSVSVPAGVYTVAADAKGFRTFTRDLRVHAGEHRELSIRLEIAAKAEEISVDPAGAITNPADNRSALSFSGSQLAMLSDDPDMLRQQLIGMAGGGAAFLSPRIYVDGFSNGQLPPKAAIRAIRINSNPYSTIYDQPGFGRIEVETQAGGSKLHGDVDVGGTANALNSKNPYAEIQPTYHQLLYRGSLGGPIGKKTSFFFAGASSDLENNAVVNAFDPAAPENAVSEAVPDPLRTDVYSLRLDRQFSAANQLNGRYAFNRTHLTNGGVGQLVLPSEGYANETTSHTVNLADNEIFSPRIVNDTRLQFIRTTVRQDPNDTSATIIVQGSFNGGGSPVQALHDTQTEYEVQDNLAIEHGRHYIRTGLRYRRYLDRNDSSAGFNGQYIFPDLPAYKAGKPSQFNLTTGQTTADVTTGDASLYAEDDWKLASNFTFSYGLRFETQTGVPDNIDPAPRVGFAWAIRPRQARVPVLTLRGGVGLFYDRFGIANLLQATRQNGTNQIAYFVQNPSYGCSDPTAVCGTATSSTLNASEPTIYQVDPNLRSSYSVVTSVTAERMIGRIGAITVNYLQAHGDHLYLSRNINSPLPGSLTPAMPSGSRPLGGMENVYQYSSAGEGNGHMFFSNLNLQPTRRLSVFAFYVLQHNYSDANGASAFASNSYDVKQDYGPEDSSGAQQFFVGGSWSLPLGLTVAPFISARSGRPFNIVTGTDLNGDTIYNDRPAFATDLSRPSVVRTAFGNFDTAPLPTQRLVPYNYGRSPGLFWVDLQAKETLHVGPRAALAESAPAAGSAAKPGARGERPWTLAFSVEAQNLFNHVNPGLPVGVLGSPFFGRPLSLASDFSSLTAANRSFLLHSTFTF